MTADILNASAKIEVKTEIPSTSSARALDAITDIIRPISETCGLIGDRVQLARQATLNKIASLAKERLLIEQQPLREIPNKFFIPLLEKASLESFDNDDLINMWANLIVSSATSELELLGRYIDILSNLTSTQVKILEKMAACDNTDQPFNTGFFIDKYHELSQSGILQTLDGIKFSEMPEEIVDKLSEELDFKGVALNAICLYDTDSEGFYSHDYVHEDVYSDKLYYHFENLVSLGVIDRVEIRDYKHGKFNFDVFYYIMTPVGFDLFASCNPKKAQRERFPLET